MQQGAHDVGGVALSSVLNLSSPAVYHLWERNVHACMVLLVSKGHLTVDEMRRGIEALPAEQYVSWGYYDKWAASIVGILLQRGVITESDFDAAMGRDEESEQQAFQVGDVVEVRREDSLQRWRKPHLRTPGYIFGCTGVIERFCGNFGDPEFLAFRGSSPRKLPLYRVRFERRALWPEGETEGGTVDVEVFQPWLTAPSTEHRGEVAAFHKDEAVNGADDRSHSHDHDHSHEHDHQHDDRISTEQAACDKEPQETIGKRVAESLVRVLQQTAIVTPGELTQAVEAVDAMGTKAEGPRLVARAWVDAAFKARLLEDANAAAAELGIGGSISAYSTKLTALLNTDEVHNVVVCTLCSCYPLGILGLSPPWYKSRSYRSKVVREPRAVLREFGTELPAHRLIRVHDSTADLRYIVIPERPAGTDGWSEQELMKLVTRDSMIGVRVIDDVVSPPVDGRGVA